MGILEQARTKARVGVEDVQARRELHQLYTELGHEVFRLFADHQLDHPTIRDFAGRIHGVEQRLAALHVERG